MKKAAISTFALVMLITGAVDGVSNVPSIAIFGQQLVFFFIMAIILFLLPAGLVAAEMCAQYKDDSGAYVWSKKAFGSKFGVLVIWLQWINTMVWFPTCLTTLVGTASFLINPQLAHHPSFLVLTSLSAFWAMTLFNLKGIKRSAKIAALATISGMVIPMALIIGLSTLWFILGKPIATKMTLSSVFPPLNTTGTWTSLTAVITAFLGMELAAVHVKKVNNAHKVFPKALIYSILIIILTLGLSSFAVTLIIPHQDIVLVSGTIQAFKTFFIGYHIPWLANVLGVMLLFGSLGTMVNWLISPANGLAQAATDHYLPKTLAVENNHGVPAKILLAQGVVVTLVSMAFFLMPSINGSYWLLLDLSTELYLLMYILMFTAALKLISKSEKIILIPGGKIGGMVICVTGLVGCIIAFIVGFFPPSNINVGTHLRYVLLFSGGIILMCSPSLLLHWHKNRFDKKNSVDLFSEKNILSTSEPPSRDSFAGSR